VPYLLLPWIIEQEQDFKPVHRNWRPTNLLFTRQVRLLLKDMRTRLDHLEQAKDELQALPRSDRYLKRLFSLRYRLREANYQWKADQLAFLQSTAQFYRDYGAILRFLKFDQAMGRFSDKPEGA